MGNPNVQAARNLENLRKNPYPGRGLIIGRDQFGNLIQVCWIMGRRANSKNRVYVSDEFGNLTTVPADPSKVEDPSLIIYRAMAEQNSIYIVSNGDQTDTAIEFDSRDIRFEAAMESREFEPDEPHFTPRITGLNWLRGNDFEGKISVLRRDHSNGECIRQIYRYTTLVAGYGYCVTTYLSDGNPLPSFDRSPMILSLHGYIEHISRTIWNALNPDNRIALATKSIDPGTGKSKIHIINRFSAVS